MKKILLITLIAVNSIAFGYTRPSTPRSSGNISRPSTNPSRPTLISGYSSSNGIYIQPHIRTTPNNTKTNNYSTKGNINPTTGRPGTKKSY